MKRYILNIQKSHKTDKETYVIRHFNNYQVFHYKNETFDIAHTGSFRTCKKYIKKIEKQLESLLGDSAWAYYDNKFPKPEIIPINTTFNTLEDL